MTSNSPTAGMASTPWHAPARVWLAAMSNTCAEPLDRPAVRDDMMRTWLPESDSRYRSTDGRRRYTWDELRSRFDLVEVDLEPSQPKRHSA